MKYRILILLLMFWTNSIFSQNNTEKKLLVTSIEKLEHYNIIYLKDESINYKILSLITKDNKCKKIKIGQEYFFNLKSIFDNEIKVGEKLINTNVPNVDCLFVDEKCKICKEPEKGIYDVYVSENLEGLCYSKLQK